MLEGSSNYSVGRGTDSPFEQVGADWINGRELSAVLTSRHIEGVRVYPTRFRPNSSKLSGKWVEGVRFVVTERELFRATRLGLEIAAALTQLYPDEIEWKSNERLIGNRSTIDALRRGADPAEVENDNRDRVAEFEELREKYLLYP